MLRRLTAALAVLAFVYGFSTAPYTHAHHVIDSARDERHPHGATLVHTHASPHSDHDSGQPAPAGGQDSEQVWSVESFVFQQPIPTHSPIPALLVLFAPHAQLTSMWLGADRPRPQAHGPPIGLPSGLRAPPAFLPAFA